MTVSHGLPVIVDDRLPEGTGLLIPAGETLDSWVRSYAAAEGEQRLVMIRRSRLVRLRAEPVETPEAAVHLGALDDAVASGSRLSSWLCPACGWLAPWPLHWLARFLGVCPWWCSA